jgi:DNA invertase Pin-like site-specific DNA recombinase
MKTTQINENAPEKYCFSYCRFSSMKQSDGDSMRRQLEIAPRVAKEKGWTLRDDLSAKSEAKSAYKGSNVEAIEAVIQAAQSGKIPSGSVCILEALDRLTRLTLDEAYQLFRRVILAGVEIYTDKSGRHMTKSDLNNPMSLMMTVCELDAGFQSSDKLAMRVSAAWKTKRAMASEGIVMGMNVPAWLDADTKAHTIKPNAKTAIVQRIFDSYASGKGIRTIMRELNHDKILPFGKGRKNKDKAWSSTHIHRLLCFRGVIGEYQPCRYETIQGTAKRKRVEDGKPITDYYPAVIEKPLFFKVQKLLEKRVVNPKTGRASHGLQAGRRGSVTNLFTGLVKCPHCNSSMVIKQSGLHRGKYDYTSLVCYNAMRGNGCKYHTLQYSQVERAVLTLIFYKVVPALTETNEREDKLITLKGELQHAQKQLKKWESIINESSDVPPATALKQLNFFETRQIAITRQIESLEATLDDNPLMSWRPVQNTPENRLRLQTILSNEIESLTVDAVNRTAKLTMKSPRLLFEIAWPHSIGTNSHRTNPADFGFSCDGEPMRYYDIWKALDIPNLTAENIVLDKSHFLTASA